MVKAVVEVIILYDGLIGVSCDNFCLWANWFRQDFYNGRLQI